MTVSAFEGVAGSGKTVSLMNALAEAKARDPLREGQRVLALTFMHGARKRLHERLRAEGGLRSADVCVTIDSFAQRLTRRWRGLARSLGVPELGFDQFDAQCDAAGLLLEQDQVRSWLAASFPIIVVDEAQDLRPQRLRMIRAVAQSTTLLIAADEFQCLVQDLRPNPGVAWIREVCEPAVLEGVHRTREDGLLRAAATVRAGDPPATRGAFRILTAARIPMAAAYLANAIAWSRGGNVAVITPSLAGGFAREVVARVGQQACGSQGNGPYTIHWDASIDADVARMVDGLRVDDPALVPSAIEALSALDQAPPVRQTIVWLRRQQRAGGIAFITRVDLMAALTRHASAHRQHVGNRTMQLTAMTVPQAKNREFEGVVVLWPFQIGGDAEHRRRLLYNAITRARRWCTVILQGQALGRAPPFA